VDWIGHGLVVDLDGRITPASSSFDVDGNLEHDDGRGHRPHPPPVTSVSFHCSLVSLPTARESTALVLTMTLRTRPGTRTVVQ
jgi:hypothetical protein